MKPLKIDITSVEQGKITVRGDLDPEESSLELKVDDLALAPFNSYATTYSPYGIADGALTIVVKADGKGGKYVVTNDIRLKQFDLSGAEGDSLFEQNFGVPLSLALALLRDIQGNIDLDVPMQVDQEGKAQVDVMAVVRSALKQALAGAITSPLKMLGAVAGGSGAPIAPQPIAFRLGRAEPTGPGAESATRLAAFLVSRPAMGVQLSSAPTPDDARWLHEHALLGTWAEEGFFERSVAFVAERGPRERIRAYLEARVEDQKPELSAEDAATLDEWLKEVPEPTPEAAAGAGRRPHRGGRGGAARQGDRRRTHQPRRAAGGCDEADRRDPSAHREEPRAAGGRRIAASVTQSPTTSADKGGTMLKEFRDFAMKGNVLDMAIGIIIGAAFGKIVSSFVADLLMPPLSMLMGKVDFTELVPHPARRRLCDVGGREDRRRGDAQLRRLHQRGDRLRHRRVRHLPRRQADQSPEEGSAAAAAPRRRRRRGC